MAAAVAPGNGICDHLWSEEPPSAKNREKKLDTPAKWI
jgi:hypothetical protein